MKYLKWMLFPLLLCIILPFSLYGQQRQVASANVRISLIKALQVNKLQGDLLFGDIVQTGVSTKVERSPERGILFEVNGNPGRNVTVDFENTVLHNSSENQDINFTPRLSHTKNNINYIEPIAVSKGSSHKLENINGSGYLYLWVGGEISVKNNFAVGDYSGDFSVTVSY